MMSRATKALRRQLDEEKDRLSITLHELSARAEAAVDWRHQFAKRPEVMMGLALIGGAVVGSMTAGAPRRTRGRVSHMVDDASERPPVSTRRPKGAPLLQRTAAAALSLAAGRAVSLAESIIGEWADEILRPRPRRSAAKDGGDE